MSIATDTSKIQYTLSSGAQALPVPFYFLENAHVQAYKAGDTPVLLVLGTDYTLTGAGDEDGGTLTTIAGTDADLLAGDQVTIRRNIEITQEVNYVYNDRFPAETHERALDKLTMIAQQLAEVAGRAIQFHESEIGGAGNKLPTAASRAGKILGFTPDGTAVQLLDPVSAVFANGDVVQVNSITALKAVDVTALTNGYQAFAAGYYNPGDQGGGVFVYDSASAATANNGTVVAPNAGTGRWIRQHAGPFNVLQFGAVRDGVTDDGAKFRAAILAAANNGGGTVLAPSGDYKIATSVIIPSSVVLDLDNSTITGPGVGSATDLFQSGYLDAGAIVTNIGEAPGTHYVLRGGVMNGMIVNAGKAFNLLSCIDNCIFTNLVFENCTYAVRAEVCFYSSFKEMFSRGSASAAANAAFLFTGAVNVENLESIFVTDRAKGIEVAAGAYGLTLRNCSAEQGGTGIVITGENGPIKVDTCYLEGLTGYGIDANSTGPKFSLTIDNSFFNAIDVAAIRGELTEGQQLLVHSNNQFIDCTANVIHNDDIFAAGLVSIPTVAISNNGTPEIPAAYSLGRKADVDHKVILQDSVSGGGLIKTRVHGPCLIPFEHEGDSGSPKSSTVAFCEVSFEGGTTFDIYVDTTIVWRAIGMLVGYHIKVVDNLGTYHLFGVCYGSNVKEEGSSGKTVTASDNGGFLRLTLNEFTHPSASAAIEGIVRHL